MNDVGERPGDGGGEEGDAEEDEVQDGDRGEVPEPHASCVQPRSVGVRNGRRRHCLHGYHRSLSIITA